MPRHLGWVVVAAAFIGLSFFVGHKPTTEPARWIDGNDLANHVSPEAHTAQAVGVRGTVDRVTTKHTGTRTVHLIADDGAPVTIILMPTVEVALPGSGDRIAVQGKPLDAGVLMVEESGQLTFLPPESTSSERGHWIGQLTNRTRLPSGAHSATLMDGERFLMPCLVQRGVSLVGRPQGQTVIVTGYIGRDGTLVAERVDLADFD